MNFDQGTNILYGDNAQGKTNILEAVYLAGTSKSHKGSKNREMIRFENEESHIRMMVKKGDLSYKIDMHLRKNKAKGVAINGLPIRKARELLGVVNLVFFSPEDLNIIKNRTGREKTFSGFGALSAGWCLYHGAGRLQSHREPEKPSSQRLLYEPRAEKHPGCLGYADGRLRKEDHREAGSLCGGA